MSTSSGKRLRMFVEFLTGFVGFTSDEAMDILRVNYRDHLMQSKGLPADAIGDEWIDHMLSIDEVWEIPSSGKNGWIEIGGVKWPVNLEDPILCVGGMIDGDQCHYEPGPRPCCCEVSLEPCCEPDFETLSIEVL